MVDTLFTQIHFSNVQAYARAKCGVFYARLSWQGMLIFYKGSIFVITETQFGIQGQAT